MEAPIDQRPISILFGPQSTLTPESISEIRTTILQDPALRFLNDVLKNLSLLWHSITEAWPALRSLPGETYLIQLGRFFQEGGEPPAFCETSNVISTPLAVVSQIIDFWKTKDHIKCFYFSENSAERPPLIDVQGFCIGSLTAAAAACSRNTEDFENFSSKAVHLAVCIGAAVDFDALNTSFRGYSIAIRWRSDLEHQYLEDLLDYYHSAYISCCTDTDRVTVTVNENILAPLMNAVAERGMSARLLELRGRYHHDDHESAVQHIASLCESDARFAFPDAQCLALPLRSTVNGAVITNGPLHTVLLESILTERSQWLLTVSAVLEDARKKNVPIRFIPVGAGSFVPPSVMRKEACQPPTRPKLANKSASTYASPIDPVLTPSDTSSAGAEGSKFPIAIIGMGCRYPNADSPEELWELLEKGICAVQDLPESRLKISQLTRGPDGPFYGGLIQDPDVFDHRFFGISGREAKSMDPQQRVLLQVAYEALESSGYCGLRSDKLPSDIGCYVGVGADDYGENVGSHPTNAFSATGTLKAFNPGRISHHFGWSGPSVVVDSACSSAAVSIHLACQALQTNDCSVALAGGVSIMTNPKTSQNLAGASFLSKTGASKAFDAAADGYCRGEGAGLVLLRPLADALRNGDPVLAVITGSAVNQGSNCSPITVPDSNSQQLLYRKALSSSGVDPKEVTYVEAHGTGTQVGDPIEFDSIRRAFGGRDRKEDVHVGSIKDNIGHTETASGSAALIKTILMMQKGRIPKQANFSCLNPKIRPLGDDRVLIPTRSRNWETAERIALVTNYGAAGNNAAMLVREHATTPTDESSSISELPFFVSARTSESLRSYCKALHEYIRKGQCAAVDVVGTVGYNLAIKQSRDMEYFLNFTTPSDTTSLLDQLNAATWGNTKVQQRAGPQLPVILCFGGQNGKTACLSEDLVRGCKVLQNHLNKCNQVCSALGLPSLFPTIFDPAPKNDLVSLHCTLFSIQYSTAKAWMDCGLKVDRLIGHSFGQLTALCVAEVLSLDDAMRLISGRAQLIQEAWGPDSGTMLAIECTKSEAESLLQQAQQQSDVFADIACFNGPTSLVLAGDKTSIQGVEEVAHGLPSKPKMKRLNNTHAFHSRLVDKIVPGLTAVAKELQYRKPLIPIEACSVNENWLSVTAESIVKHSRGPVHFMNAVENASKQLGGPIIWLEAGSGSPVIPMIRQVLGSGSAQQHVYQRIDIGDSKAQSNLAKATSGLWGNGVRVQFWPFQNESYEWVNLPPYQFAKTRHWLEYIPPQPPSQQTETISSDAQDELMRLIDAANGILQINTKNPFYRACTRGHAVVDQSLCPASLYIELVMRAVTLASNADHSASMVQIEGLEICSPLVLAPEGQVFLQLQRGRGNEWTFLLFTRIEDQEKVTHATGSIAIHESKSTTVTRLRSIERLIDPARCHSIIDSPKSDGFKGSIVYQAMKRVTDYADYYKGVQNVSATNEEAAGYVSLPTQPSELVDGHCDPILVDNFLQVAGIHVNCLSENNPDEVYVCGSIGEIFISPEFLQKQSTDAESSWLVYTNQTRYSKTELTCDVFAINPRSKKLLLTLMSAKFKSVSIRSLRRLLSRLNTSSSIDSGPSKTTETTASLDRIETRQEPRTQEKKVKPVHDSESNGAARFHVQEMLSELIGIPIDELQPSSCLDDIGIDSLMITEVVSEIRKRFGVSIDSSALQSIADVQSLVAHIFPESSTSNLPSPSKSFVQHVKAKPQANHPPADSSAYLIKIRHILSDILDIPIQEITASSSLDSLGIDSLVATELLTEINKHFGVSLGPGELQNINDTQGLCVFLQGPSEKVSIGVLSESNNVPEKPFASVAHKCFASSGDEFLKGAQESQWAGFYDSVYPSQMALVAAYVVEAFRSLGCPLESLHEGQSVPDVKVAEQHRKVQSQLYAILESTQLIGKSKDGAFIRTGKHVPATHSQMLHEDIIQQYPQHRSEHLLLHTTGPRLADCLVGRENPLSLLFRDARARQLMEDVYTNAPMFKAATAHLTKFLSSISSQIETGRDIQILEIGAGTGGTTKHLMPQLMAIPGVRFRYTFTDISPSLVALAKKKFTQYHNCMEFTTVDLEKEPPASMHGRYDIIISTNCVHATRNLVQSCSNICKYQRPDGILCLVELTRNLFWFDLVFGLLEGWWLFDDGRKHALANEHLWEETLLQSGYKWVDWAECGFEESNTSRLIVASPMEGLSQYPKIDNQISLPKPVTEETVTFAHKDGIALQADIYYPEKLEDAVHPRPVALMIHGGGHVMLSRKDVRPQQTQTLLELGFLPVSVDYRLCPETSLIDGPMRDVCDAFSWARTTLPKLQLQRPDIRPRGDQVVAVGWSTGGHLAMTLAWTASKIHGIQPPEAILAFYCPTDYEDPFWWRENIPFGRDVAPPKIDYDSLQQSICGAPITGHNPSPNKRALAGWMAPDDSRTQIALYMNWTGQTLPILLKGWMCPKDDTSISDLPTPTAEEIQAVSPLAMIRQKRYSSPTFIIHGTLDDLIPWEQVMRTYDTLREAGVDAEIRMLDGVVHLFDLYPSFAQNHQAVDAVEEGYKFLWNHVEV